jgi:hypothetical protein
VARDELPACIETCPEDVQTIGPRAEIVALAHERAKEINGYVYGEHENGGTNTLYVSPVPFETLNAAIEKGPGKPHLGPAEDRMADANHLGAALLIAPLAGAATALGRYLKAARRAGQSPTSDDASNQRSSKTSDR